MPTLSNDQVRRRIDEIQRALRSDDPAFVRRFGVTGRAEVATAIALVTFLASGAVLSTIGLAIGSWVALSAGAIALLASVAVDGHDRRRRQRSLGQGGRHATHLREVATKGGRLFARATHRMPGASWLWPASPRPGARRGWDQRVVLGCTMEEISAHLRGPDALAGWFPDVTRVQHDGGTDLVVGEHGGTRLRVRAERWVRGAGGTMEAAVDGTIITAHLTMRTVVVPSAREGVVESGVEIWVHAEVDDGRRAGGVLRVLESVTGRGLRHMKAELGR